MARGSGNSQSSGRSKGKSSSSNGRSRSSSQKRKREEFPDYEILDPDEIEGGPDVMLDVPVVKADEIDVEVDDLRAAISVRAELRALVQLNVGVAARLGTVELNIQGLEAQALLKARLDNVSQILARVMTTLDRNPDLLESVGKAIEDVGGGAGDTMAGAGEATEDVGEGTEKALGDVGQGAGQAAGDVGKGAGKAAGEVGKGGSQAAKGVGGGAKQLAGGGRK
ncbi:MAG TPA: hypothetical protein VFH44_09815 [Solirubrobacterales bacterium]|nr:hypothetical protein [Solirubrobacterales bacterium]